VTTGAGWPPPELTTGPTAAKSRTKEWFRSFFAAGIAAHDDAGRPVVLSPRLSVPRPPETPPTHEAPSETLPIAARPSNRTVVMRIRLVLSLFITLAALVGMVALASAAIRAKLHTSLPVAAVFAVAGLVGYAVVVSRFGIARAGPQLAWMVIARGLRSRWCPACSYSVEHVPVRSGGDLTCPECGAVWDPPKWAREYPELRPPAVAEQGVSRAMRGRFLYPDARGRPVPLLGSRPKERRAVLHSADPGWSRDLRIGDAVRVALVLAPLTFLLIMRREPIAAALMASIAEVFVVPAVLITRIHAKRHARRVRFASTSIAAHRCPCCESPLREEPSSLDGALVCDRCGAAWKSAAD
jgi:hypothetical protein